MSNRYRKGSHCKYSLKTHIILVTKYRKKILYDKISDVLNMILLYRLINDKETPDELREVHMDRLNDFKSKWGLKLIQPS